MSKNLIDESKAYLPKFYDGGEWIEKPIIRFNGRYVDDKVIDFMSDFFHFLIESSFLSEYTIIWLNSNMPSVKKTLELYNSQVDEIEQINESTFQSAITYDKKKLSKRFDVNLLFNVMTYPEKHLDRSIEILDSLVREYFNDKEYRQSLVIKVPKEYITKTLSNSDWNRLLDTLKVYCSESIKRIESLESDEMTKEMAGYFNFIISSHRLNKDDQMRLDEMKKILNILDKPN